MRARVEETRAQAVRDQYGPLIMSMPGVVSVGVTDLDRLGESLAEKLWPKSRGVGGYALAVGVRSTDDVPDVPLVLNGVPILVRAVGEPRRVRRQDMHVGGND